MKRILVLSLVVAPLVAVGQTNNIIIDPGGQSWDATSNTGYFWAGFGVGLLFYSFGFVLRFARRTTGSSDF